MIKFDKVTYEYAGGSKVIDNLSVKIESGEKVAVVGENGSGKTTFALLINGIYRATSGNIEVNGLNPQLSKDSQRLKQKIGLVFQNPDNQLVSTTVEREIAFSLENQKMPRAEMKNRLAKSLGFYGLENYRSRLTSELSGGEKQRLALAAVMVAEPDILILDEPESYLDESGKDLLKRALDNLLDSKPNLTVIHITQYPLVAENYTRMLVFRRGTIVDDDSPGNIFSDEEMHDKIGIGAPLKYRRGFDSIKQPEVSNSENILSGRDKYKAITLKDIEFHYEKERQLFRDININIDNNSIWGLVGPSGCGKTTLIQLMASLIKPQSGDVNREGFDKDQAQIAVSFQHPERQFFLETVDEEMRFAPDNMGLSDIDRKVANAYGLVGIERERYHDRYPFSLSGGEKRRLAFGTVLTFEPPFIFFDEPTSALDYPGIIKFQRLVRNLADRGIGVLIISHYGDIILELADKIIAMDSGRIESIREKRDFFSTEDYSSYLSTPDIISYQREKWGEVRFFSERELLLNI